MLVLRRRQFSSICAYTLNFVVAFAYAAAAGKLASDCVKEERTFARRTQVGLSAEYKPASEVIQVHESPPSDCFAKCYANPNCSGYFIDYRTSSCLLIQEKLKESYLIPSEGSSYHWKICLSGSRKAVRNEWCRSHEWAFDVVPGIHLLRYRDMTIRNVTSLEQCMSKCTVEDAFRCRSAIYEHESGTCTLSRHDRRTAPEVFHRGTKSASSYLERQCIEEPSGCQFRARGPRFALSFRRQHVQVVEGLSSRTQCEKACLEGAPFPCKAYQYAPAEDGHPAACLLSPDDSSTSSIGPILQSTEDIKSESHVFEKESCVESEVRCGPTAMSVTVKVATPFRGRLYALGHPYECYSVNVDNDGRLTLDIPLHGRRCGTRNLGNGTFINSVVVQHHPFVLRNADRRIEVACDYQQLSRVKIRGSKGVRHSDFGDGDLRPFSQQTVTAVAPTPPIRLRVVNASDQEVSGAELGDPLFLKVELADESVYGIFGSDLVARSSAGSETVLLIDDNGCSVEPTVISSLERLPGSKSLVAPFQAFKFASDSAVKFQLTVSYCLDSCSPVDCENDTSSSSRHQSYGKRKRRAATSGRFLELQPGDVVGDVHAETAYFIVKSFGPSWMADQTHRLIQPQFLTPPEGQVRIRVAPGAFCVDSTTVYMTAVAAGVLQLAIVGACLSLFLFSGGCKCYKPTCAFFAARRKLTTKT